MNSVTRAVSDATPIVRWSGSKRAQLRVLTDLCPPVFNTYYEPFCGSACLFLKLRPKKAILSDLNAELIGMYRTVRRRARDVAAELTRLPAPKVAYYDVRATDPRKLTSCERAARFLYLN